MNQFQVLISTVSLLLIALQAQANVEFPRVKSVTVHRAFQLRRIDGRMVTLKPESTAPADLSGLPKAVDADQSLCGDLDSQQPKRLLRQTSMMLELSKIGHALDDGKRKRMTPTEIAFVKTAPRCEPFTPLLAIIAEALSTKTPEKSYEVVQMKFTSDFFQTPILELLLDDWILDRGSKVHLALPGFGYWSAGGAQATSTGQGVSVVIKDLGEDAEPDRGGGSEGWERCRTDDGRPGRRYYTSEPVYFHRNWRISFANSAGKRLMTIIAATQRTENEGRTGECWPIRHHDRRFDHALDRD